MTNVRLELEAAFAASGRQTLTFAPAFPAAGRTTVGGVQFVDGVAVAESSYGRDPVHPARHSVLADLVPNLRAKTLILDAKTQDELDEQIAAVANPETVLWVGSPGMASSLARRFAPAERAAPVHTVTGEILVIIGTANPRSHAQAAVIEDLLGVTLMRSPTSREADPVFLLARIANAATQRLRDGGVAALIATGGDTMEAILARLGTDEFELLQELEPGFPLGRITGHDGHLLLIATKAGGFGDGSTLRRAIAYLRASSPPAHQGRP